MSRRPASIALAVVLATLAVATAPATALAQSSPFAPLPSEQTTTEQQQPQTVTTTSVPTQGAGGLKTWQSLLIIAAGVVLLGGLAWVIVRDARRRAPVTAGQSESPGPSADTHRRGQHTKQRQRARNKAARAQRRRNR